MICREPARWSGDWSVENLPDDLIFCFVVLGLASARIVIYTLFCSRPYRPQGKGTRSLLVAPTFFDIVRNFPRVRLNPIIRASIKPMQSSVVLTLKGKQHENFNQHSAPCRYSLQPKRPRRYPYLDRFRRKQVLCTPRRLWGVFHRLLSEHGFTLGWKVPIAWWKNGRRVPLRDVRLTLWVALRRYLMESIHPNKEPNPWIPTQLQFVTSCHTVQLIAPPSESRVTLHWFKLRNWPNKRGLKALIVLLSMLRAFDMNLYIEAKAIALEAWNESGFDIDTAMDFVHQSCDGHEIAIY